MLNKLSFIIILSMLFISSAFADGVWVAILETTGDKSIEIPVKKRVTDKIRSEALKVLNDNSKYKIIDKDAFKERLPEGVSLEDCTDQCAVEIGKNVSANFIIQSIISKLENKYTLSIIIYDIANGNLISNPIFDAENTSDFDNIIEKNSTSLFENIIKRPWSGVEYKVDNSNANFLNQKIIPKRIIKITSIPAGAKLSIDGTVASECPKTPCSISHEEGTYEFKFSLERYATQQKTVQIKGKNQTVEVKMVPTFGILKIKPQFTDGIGNKNDLTVNLDGQRQAKYDSITINDYDKHKVLLTHKCYENMEVTIGFDHGGQEHIIDTALTISQSILDLNVVDENGQPIEVDVFVNGKNKGQSPFTDFVPTCSKISVGPFRETIEEVNFKKNLKDSLTYKYKGISSYTDKRKGNGITYDLINVGDDIWFKQNLKYKTGNYSSVYVSYSNYNYFYNYTDAVTACPAGFHMASYNDWEKLLNNKGQTKLSLSFDGAIRKSSSYYYDEENIDNQSKDYFWLTDTSAIVFSADSTIKAIRTTDDYKLPVRCVKDN